MPPVLGVQVPVSAYRNALLMGRLMVNLSQALDGDETLETLLDVWHHTQTTNLVNDIVSSNRKRMDWVHAPRPGLLPPIQDFMVGAGTQVPRPRDGYYRDTVKRLLVVADQSGDRERVRAWMSRSFVPETTFYQFVGEPERIILRPPPAMLLADAAAAQ